MKILVIEDEVGIANSIRKGLIQEKYVVDLAHDGQMGYELAADKSYDVIILDLMLPLMDGSMVCQKLREDKVTTPILMLTAKGSVGEKVNGLAIGADDYLAKPFAFEELVARVRALARRPLTLLSPTLRAGELTLNTETYEVKFGQKIIPVSAKEYALLEYLLREAPNIVSKDKIIEHVWGYDNDILPNTVEVYIKKLRAKIPAANVVTTVRGFGYRIVDPAKGSYV